MQVYPPTLSFFCRFAQFMRRPPCIFNGQSKHFGRLARRFGRRASIFYNAA
jgi:hypothetical protein